MWKNAFAYACDGTAAATPAPIASTRVNKKLKTLKRRIIPTLSAESAVDFFRRLARGRKRVKRLATTDQPFAGCPAFGK
ncbi:hypothetical protein GCM10027569_03530 [Flindersiella endophytica]